MQCFSSLLGFHTTQLRHKVPFSKCHKMNEMSHIGSVISINSTSIPEFLSTQGNQRRFQIPPRKTRPPPTSPENKVPQPTITAILAFFIPRIPRPYMALNLIINHSKSLFTNRGSSFISPGCPLNFFLFGSRYFKRRFIVHLRLPAARLFAVPAHLFDAAGN